MILLWVNGIIAAMDDPRILRVITVGLVLASLAVGYFLLTGGLSPKKPKTQSTPTPAALPVATIQPQQTATPSAYSRIAERSQEGVQTLPNTGFSVGLAVIFSVSAIVSGLSLRKFPN